MGKRIAFVFLAILVLFTASLINKSVVFEKYAQSFEVYVGESSSRAQIINADTNNLYLLKNVYGQSFKTERKNFDLEAFLKDFNAKVVLVEPLECGVSIYAYSKQIKYRENIDGKIVNLQIFLSKQVTVGTPLIFGSF